MPKQKNSTKATPQVHAHSKSHKIDFQSSVRYVDVNKTLVAYKLELGAVAGDELPPAVKSAVERRTTEGIATREEVMRFLANEVSSITPLRDFELTHPKLRAELRKHGMVSAFDRLASRGLEASSETPFTDLVERGANVQDILHLDWDSSNVFDINGEPLAVVQFFDYVNAGISCSAYDIQKAELILRKNKRVSFFNSTWDAIPRHKSAIQMTHGYGVAPNRYLQFAFEPTQEEVSKLWLSLSDKKRQTFNLSQAILASDLLGLNAAKLTWKKRKSPQADC